MNKFPERLKELREEKGLTQRELGKRVGTSGQNISRWEKGEKMPTLNSIIPLCIFFGCSSDYLIGLKDEG